MGKTTGITWTDVTWNIARGCTKVDEDCKHCYMYRDSFDSTRYNPLKVVRTKTVFNLPLKIKEPSKIFTSSLTDVFHEDCDSFRNEMWSIIRECHQHTFQILTKRPERIAEHLPEDWGNGWDNVWLGTSIGSTKGQMRIWDLTKVKSKTKFLSLEPLYEPLDLGIIPLASMDWVIIGGESGNDTGKYRYRECKLEWIGHLVNQCIEAKVPVFVKQLGTHLAKEMKMSDRHGGNINEFPEAFRIRQFPNEPHKTTL